MKRILFAVLFMVVTLPAQAAAPSPDQIARTTTDDIIALLKTNKAAYAKDHRKLFAMVDEHVLPHFDFNAMSRTVLGRYWRQANDDQRKRFVAEFRDLLVRTYATALLKYNNEKIVYLPFRTNPGDRTAMVKSEVRRSDGGPPISLTYSFYHTDADWKVYDVTIEGASLVTTYQSTYAEQVRRDGLDALIANLSKDNHVAADGKTASNGGAKEGAKK
ncbi:MAG: MlaC/ttg2D family ABC transporter substrate-binding protein [Sulfuricaulis sp.]